MRRLLPVAIVSMLLVAAGSAQAAPVADGIFDLPKPANRVALGPDGNMWVALGSDDPDVARVSPDGTVTPFTATDLNSPVGIVAGPDGNMWATQINGVVKFSPSNPAGAVKTTVNAIGGAKGITVGQDGNLWTASGGNVIRIPPANPAGFTVIPSNVTNFDARETTSSSDGTIWVANGEGNTPGVLPVSLAGTAGTMVAASTTGQVNGVAAGPNGQIAYTQPNADPQRMGLINGGALAAPFLFPAPADPNGIVFGQDGSYWVAQSNPSIVGRYSTDGVYTKFADMPANSFPRWIAQGANNAIWVILERPGEDFSRIARITGVEPPDSVAPIISSLKLTNKIFKVGAKKTALVAKKKKTPTGTTIKYSLDEAATVTIAVEKAAAGRKSGKSCVKPTKKLKKAKKCTRYVAYKEKLTRLQLAGPNKVAFSGRFGKTKLKAGKYRFSITATDARGNTSKPSTTKFTISTK